MQDLPEPRPLWQWIALAIAPGLLCDVLGWFGMLAQRARADDLAFILTLSMLAAPLIGFVYLIALGRRYVRAGMDTSAVIFVVGYGLLNMLLWGAGCAMQLSGLSFH